MLNELYDVIEARKRSMPAGSYTAELMAAGEARILRKVGEEALEVIFAAQGEGDERLVEEVADLTYHVLVLLASRGLKPEKVAAALQGRRKGAG